MQQLRSQDNQLVDRIDRKVDSINQMMRGLIRYDTSMKLVFIGDMEGKAPVNGQFSFHFKQLHQLFKISFWFQLDTLRILSEHYYENEQLLRIDMGTARLNKEVPLLVSTYWQDFELQEIRAGETAGPMGMAERYLLSLVAYRHWQIASGRLNRKN